MTSLTDDDIIKVLGQLSLNYRRPIDDEDAAIGLVDMWRTQIGGCAVEDVTVALQAIMGDPEVKFFPTVAEFRRRVIDANVARRAREAAANPDPHESFSCLGCKDSGWLDAGTDDDGYWFVRACGNGCKPQNTHRARHPRVRGRRRAPSEPTQLTMVSGATLDQAVADTARMQGEHRDPEF